MEISAKIIADSVANDVRITTMELCYPRFIHAEAKTHRILSLDDEEYELVLKQDIDLMDDAFLSRNASSSRAIPVEKMIKQVEEHPAMPIHWGRNQPGMQARKEIDNKAKARYEWLHARDKMLTSVTNFELLDIHKQVVNRLLEPFQWIKVIVTATEWDDFFRLRLHPDAQPEIKRLAECMKGAMLESVAIPLKSGEWHLPYVEQDRLWDIDVAIKCSAARCARVSYLNHDKTNPTIDKDLSLADKLLEAGHMSPFEHIAMPMKYKNDSFVDVFDVWENGVSHVDRNGTFWSGNFRGFLQYRKILEDTNWGRE